MVLIQFLLTPGDKRGKAFDAALLARVGEELTTRFGRVTAYVHTPAQGTWLDGEGAIERDQAIPLEVRADAFDRP